jgi:hypothetical protein
MVAHAIDAQLPGWGPAKRTLAFETGLVYNPKKPRSASVVNLSAVRLSVARRGRCCLMTR